MSTFSQFFQLGTGFLFPTTKFRGYKAGLFYPASISWDSLYTADANTTPLTANKLYYLPFFCQQTHTFTGISIAQISSGTTGNVRLGIYDDTGAIGPGALVIDGGAVVCGASTGNRTATISQSLTLGSWYWLAVVSDAAIKVYGGTVTFGASGVSAVGNALRSSYDHGIVSPSAMYSSGNPSGGFIATQSYGALPSTAAAPTADVGPIPFLTLVG